MKKLFSLLIIFLTLGVKAQKNLPFYEYQSIHWGFTFGINHTNFLIQKNQIFVDSIYYAGIEAKSGKGIFLGPIFNLKIFNPLDIRALLMISFTERNITYYFYDQKNNGKIIKNNISIPSSYIELPILLKYKSSRILDNYRPYLVGGINIKYDLATNRKINTDEPYLLISPIDIQYEIGPGLDIFLPYFKFSIEVKYGGGIINILDAQNTIHSRPIDKIFTNVVYFSLHFEG